MPSVLNKALKIGEFHENALWKARPSHFPPLFSTLANIACCIANLGMRVLSRFLAAATDAAQFPAPSIPEIAFLGRSNVGKSSVINSLVGTKLARTSSTPGRTRSINFFEFRCPGKRSLGLFLPDRPGYVIPRIHAETSPD